jgi:LmbE family N-acetylglucosaminyl deacetylase
MNAIAHIAMNPALATFAAYLADPSSTGAELVLVVAHPDDETLAFGGQLGRLPRTTIVCLTDGAPADLRDAHAHGFADAAAYAAVRRQDMKAALAIVDYPGEGLVSLGIPDQQVACRLAGTARELALLIEQHRPRFIVSHTYEGGHPDHDAAAFAVAAACRVVRRNGHVLPRIIEFPLYFAGPDGPVYQRFAESAGDGVLELRLSPAAAAIKARMLACHATQAQTLAAFSPDIERFRLAPETDFRALPNGGRLQYEAWGLGLTGASWLGLARAAADELGLPA